MAENKGLTFKGRPLMRKDNLIYYGSMADSHIVLLQILDYKKVGDRSLYRQSAVKAMWGDGKDEQGAFAHAKYNVENQYWKIPD
jgi:hypothetical protein